MTRPYITSDTSVLPGMCPSVLTIIFNNQKLQFHCGLEEHHAFPNHPFPNSPHSLFMSWTDEEADGKQYEDTIAGQFEILDKALQELEMSVTKKVTGKPISLRGPNRPSRIKQLFNPLVPLRATTFLDRRKERSRMISRQKVTEDEFD
jgi:hypothetical protein